MYAGAVEATPMTMLETQSQGAALEPLVALDVDGFDRLDRRRFAFG